MANLPCIERTAAHPPTRHSALTAPRLQDGAPQPAVILDSPMVRLWHRADPTFKVPKAALYIHLQLAGEPCRPAALLPCCPACYQGGGGRRAEVLTSNAKLLGKLLDCRWLLLASLLRASAATCHRSACPC